MTSSPAILVFLTTFLILLSVTAADDLSPLLSPLIDGVCKEVMCGKGKCKASLDFKRVPFSCECDPGWKHFLFDNNDFLHFLPCVIPNCTVNYSCNSSEEPSPSPEMEKPPSNQSLLDPCDWAYCGGGSCVKSSKYGHKCDCREGYANLLNQTSFPCFRECALGMDCAILGLTVANKSAAPTPNFNEQSANHATTIIHGNLLGLMILTISLAMVSWK